MLHLAFKSSVAACMRVCRSDIAHSRLEYCACCYAVRASQPRRLSGHCVAVRRVILATLFFCFYSSTWVARCTPIYMASLVSSRRRHYGAKFACQPLCPVATAAALVVPPTFDPRLRRPPAKEISSLLCPFWWDWF